MDLEAMEVPTQESAVEPTTPTALTGRIDGGVSVFLGAYRRDIWWSCRTETTTVALGDDRLWAPPQ